MLSCPFVFDVGLAYGFAPMRGILLLDGCFKLDLAGLELDCATGLFLSRGLAKTGESGVSFSSGIDMGCWSPEESDGMSGNGNLAEGREVDVGSLIARCGGSTDPLRSLPFRGFGSIGPLFSMEMPLLGDCELCAAIVFFFADDITSDIGILFAGLRIGSSRAGRVNTGERDDPAHAPSLILKCP